MADNHEALPTLFGQNLLQRSNIKDRWLLQRKNRFHPLCTANERGLLASLGNIMVNLEKNYKRVLGGNWGVNKASAYRRHQGCPIGLQA
jgi:hypothetical protein